MKTALVLFAISFGLSAFADERVKENIRQKILAPTDISEDVSNELNSVKKTVVAKGKKANKKQ